MYSLLTKEFAFKNARRLGITKLQCVNNDLQATLVQWGKHRELVHIRITKAEKQLELTVTRMIITDSLPT